MSVEKDLYDNKYETVNSLKDALSRHSEDWISCKEEDLKVGDIIFVEYSPDSQKHLYTHNPEYGTVQAVGVEKYYSANEDKTKTELAVQILNHEGQLVNINKDHLSMYSRGYCINLKKYKLTHRDLPYPMPDPACLTCGIVHAHDED